MNKRNLAIQVTGIITPGKLVFEIHSKRVTQERANYGASSRAVPI
ncbi:MAG: hypothetical protein ACFFFG_12570 [Candidatus Thorarchaeota archaeon]